MADEEWYTLLDEYPLPANQDGDPDAGELPDDDPWRAALRQAARHPAIISEASRGKVRKRPSVAPPSVTNPTPAAGSQARTGDRVSITPLGDLRGTVVSISGDLAMVQTEATRVQVRRSELRVLQAGHDLHGEPGVPSLIRHTATGLEDHLRVARDRADPRRRWQAIDLHGLMLSSALEQLDDFLYDAWDAGRDTVAVIHGRGSGKLRKEVRALLTSHPAVRDHQPARPSSGGDGVTLVTLYSPEKHPRPRR